ncbi:cytosine deaminase [Klebsiella pneumoniae]|uniref:Cytosine deaminase n=1 Tax=Klebsiella pneumoniae TaxID=573 RepID=A0A2X3GZ99_KLEPN|nr:cytosine deaminase [Klebsiella pneumoniae]
MDLAQRYGRLVDVHCDEIDDPQSRFLEVLAEEARVRGMGAQVTASHTCAMGSYDNAYCSKLFRLLKASGINFISCPTESIHLQGRFGQLAETARRHPGGGAGSRRHQCLLCPGLDSGSVVPAGERQYPAAFWMPDCTSAICSAMTICSAGLDFVTGQQRPGAVSGR